jgi:internalin A
MSDTPKHVLEKIQEAKVKQLKELDLSGLGVPNDQKLTQIPAEVFELKQLQLLKLGHNRLTAVPEAITRLQNLTQLFLRGNQLTVVPNTIAQLQNLTWLDLSDNQFATLPDAIAKIAEPDCA